MAYAIRGRRKALESSVLPCTTTYFRCAVRIEANSRRAGLG